jgi:hypothetical protein
MRRKNERCRQLPKGLEPRGTDERAKRARRAPAWVWES